VNFIERIFVIIRYLHLLLCQVGLNSNNVIIDGITIDASGGSFYAINFTSGCTNVVIRNCRLFTDPAGTTLASAAIYKGNGTPGILQNISIVNNLFDGGYAGVYLYGTSSLFSNNILVENNIIRNISSYGVLLYYTNNANIKGNEIHSRASSSVAWNGIYLYQGTGNVINNRIRQYVTGTPYGIYTNYWNYNANLGLGLIANNEIIVRTNYAVYCRNTNARILHNSMYMDGGAAGSGNTVGIYLYNNVSVFEIKNNNIVITSTAWNAAAIYCSSQNHLSTWDIDYNNFYSPSYLAYLAGYMTTIQEWQAVVTTDKHSVSVLPSYVDVTQSLELSDYTGLSCTSHNLVTEDITGKSRPNVMTTMGSYQGFYPFDLLLQEIIPSEVVSGQDVPVYIKIVNLGNTAINKAVFNWSVNGVQQPTFRWTTSNPITLFEDSTIFIGSFPAPLIGRVMVEVWTDSVNNTLDTVIWDNRISSIVSIIPLARFAEPLVEKPVHTSSFDVYVQIMEGTGATKVTPKMTVQSRLGNVVSYDTVTMTYQNGLWKAIIPEQPYGSTVAYSVTVSDSIGNTATITDSTFIEFTSGGKIG
jgi:hypothetical protein